MKREEMGLGLPSKGRLESGALDGATQLDPRRINVASITKSSL